MSPDSPGLGPLRPAAVVNEEIRTLMIRAGGYLRAEDRSLYEQLREEWAVAVRAEIVTAA